MTVSQPVDSIAVHPDQRGGRHSFVTNSVSYAKPRRRGDRGPDLEPRDDVGHPAQLVEIGTGWDEVDFVGTDRLEPA